MANKNFSPIIVYRTTERPTLNLAYHIQFQCGGKLETISKEPNEFGYVPFFDFIKEIPNYEQMIPFKLDTKHCPARMPLLNKYIHFLGPKNKKAVQGAIRSINKER